MKKKQISLTLQKNYHINEFVIKEYLLRYNWIHKDAVINCLLKYRLHSTRKSPYIQKILNVEEYSSYNYELTYAVKPDSCNVKPLVRKQNHSHTIPTLSLYKKKIITSASSSNKIPLETIIP